MISIIVPVYNVEPFLPQCIDSILRQTYRNLEILLIDDGSPDKCGRICDEYARADNRIRVFHTENNGLSAARNLGLREARGEYIGFVDSDDWIDSDMYEILLRHLEENKADVSACEMWVERKNRKSCHSGKRPRFSIYKDKDAIRALILWGLHTYAWNKLYRRDCWTNIWFPEEHTFEDTATIHKVILNAHIVSFTSTPLYHYRMQNIGSITSNHSMGSLMDNWNTYYDRYVFLSSLPEIKDDRQCLNKMIENLAQIIAKTWRWTGGVPQNERNHEFLRMLSGYVHKNFPLFGFKNWGIYLRTSIFLSRYVNDDLFALLYRLNRCFVFSKKNFFWCINCMQGPLRNIHSASSKLLFLYHFSNHTTIPSSFSGNHTFCNKSSHSKRIVDQ